MTKKFFALLTLAGALAVSGLAQAQAGGPADGGSYQTVAKKAKPAKKGAAAKKAKKVKRGKVMAASHAKHAKHAKAGHGVKARKAHPALH